MNKLVFGVGINDSPYPTRKAARRGGRQVTLWECPFYKTWKSMLRRCYSEVWIKAHPSYRGHAVCNEWHRLSNFSAWMAALDFEGKDLDKDILSPGNKIYSPDNCVFISGDLNKFLTENKSTKGIWPVGVHFDIEKNKFIAQIKNPFTGKRHWIGGFLCPDAAHEEWRSRKHAFACQYADMQPDPRIASALRIRYAKTGAN